MNGLTEAERQTLRSASWRFGLQTAALVLVVILVVATTVLVVVSRSLHGRGEALIASTARSIDAVHDAGPGMWVAIVADGSTDASANLPTGLPDVTAIQRATSSGRAVRTAVETDQGVLQVVTVPHDGRVVQAALDPRPAHEEMERLEAALLVAGGLGIVLAGLGGVWLTRRAVRPMASALSLQRRFVADASHELRTPLTLLSTRVQLLDRHLTDRAGTSARVREDVDGLLGDAAALAGVLDDMLLTADPRSVDAVPLDVSAVADEVVEAARAAADQRGLRLTRTGDATAIALSGYASTRRAVTALVDNALDHATSQVEVGVVVSGARVTVAVRDDGPGLGSQGASVFDRFASARRDDHRRRRHYGLGLALVAEVATQYGGAVAAGARSDGATGAEISLWFPAAPHLGRR
ncbi:sensor histidine kinase [Cellulomonas sp. McL0617]|uniref:sensor histidine kinase n=1 Tax=Cellulomonas sp. McL0617 TaxID=3415675 RepID=UPI003CFA5802